MRIRWHGQSAYTLHGASSAVLIDPFDQRLRPDGLRVRFPYRQIPPQQVDLVLVTHEHFDHNGVGVAAGEPRVIRSTAGRTETDLGEVVAIASEHDTEAGTRRGPNTIFVLTLDGVRICHMGDFGQESLRPEQRRAIGPVDLLFIPVGGGPTIGADRAAAIVRELQPRWAVPMHYRTDAIDFLEPPDAFLAQFESVQSAGSAEMELAGAPQEGALHVLHLAAPDAT
ncbi:MAG: MBL fold metallo-hydrolase [Gaiellales bacterium]